MVLWASGENDVGATSRVRRSVMGGSVGKGVWRRRLVPRTTEMRDSLSRQDRVAHSPARDRIAVLGSAGHVCEIEGCFGNSWGIRRRNEVLRRVVPR
jgi:hypothetical protein